MPLTSAPFYNHPRQQTVRSGSYTGAPMSNLLAELHRARRGAMVKRTIHPQVVQSPPEAPVAAPVFAPAAGLTPGHWTPLGEPPPHGLGPSVAELTVGRPPRAPRAGQ